ncbi:4-coumarate--CoA ligase-like [Thalictrum thalictroides]|uniref:4-coumarate--CoA ligase-like n=1 Tax=Thalictrum thalictroides TaxID=46969 RepID=A0A7J6V2G8_THATH|nr:4-coumarate--CoA ligase-like [Thalictrum thalictroides]
MAEINLSSGFCSKTKIYHSLRSQVTLPPKNQPLSASEYAISLLRSSSLSLENTIAFIDSSFGTSLSYSDFIKQTESLSFSLHNRFGLKRGDSAFILTPASLQIPILYFSLLSLGVIVSPANPISTIPEISRQISLAKPVIGFATSVTSNKLPSFRHGTILVDSLDFKSMLTIQQPGRVNAQVVQTDTAAILYSSGTTGRVKGVELTHHNFISLTAGYDQVRAEPGEENPPHPIGLFTIPLFHVFGFTRILRAVALGETIVLMERFDFVAMLKAVETYKVTYAPVSPSLVVAMAKLDVVDKFDLSSLLLMTCGGAPLGKEVSEKFISRFPNVQITQGYGMTETTGAAARMLGPEETKRYGSVGRLSENIQAKIVDHITREAEPPGQRGELWLRGPTVMKGYFEDDEATVATLDSEGWLKTGDLCYFDTDGFLYIVDRLKELIKYKAYQVPPVELEHLLQSHSEIADVAVVPCPDEEAGQIPMAFVVRKPGSNLSGIQVMEFVAKQVAPYKKIRRVAFVSSIPKSAAGKILRRELIDVIHSTPSSKL